MSEACSPCIYGPVPSRRLGRSLGIDLVPFKTCTYDCIYCQLGRTTNKTVHRREYVHTAEVLDQLRRKLAVEQRFEHMSLAGAGEPTLNSGLGSLIAGIKKMTDIPVAVFTNSSLLWMPAVQDDLMEADLALPSLDAGDRMLFRHVNRPHPDISFDRMVDGLATFANRFHGEIWLEAFLLGGVTGIPDEVEKISAIVRSMKLSRIQMNTVARPPAESFAMPVSDAQMAALKTLLPGKVETINNSCSCEAAPSSRNPKDEEIVGLLARRPCTSLDVSSSLGINIMETLKRLETLTVAGRVRSSFVNQKEFYVAADRFE